MTKLVKIHGKPSVSYYRLPDEFLYNGANPDLEAMAPHEITEEDYGLEMQQLEAYREVQRKKRDAKKKL